MKTTEQTTEIAQGEEAKEAAAMAAAAGGDMGLAGGIAPQTLEGPVNTAGLYPMYG